MTLRLAFPPGQVFGQVGFAYSPAMEAALSLRAVVDPKRHPMHLPWSRSTRDLSPDLRAEIELLSFTFRDYLPGVFEVGLTGDHPTIDDELHRIETFDDDVVLFELTMPFGGWDCATQSVAFSGDPTPAAVHESWFQDQVLERARVVDERQADVLAAAFVDPAAIRTRIATMLRRYWDEAFAREWSRVQDRLDAEIAEGSRLLVSGGPGALVDELVPEATWDPDGWAIVLDKRRDVTVDVAARGGLSLVPTVYGWPRVAVEIDPPWSVAIIHPIRALQSPEQRQPSDSEVAAGLRALGDETRLQISRLVATEPRSTTELAQLLSLSESSVSRHLKTLAGAGILAAERDGHYVLYRLAPERIGALGGALRRQLGLGPAPSTGRQRLPVVGPRRAEDGGDAPSGTT
ncbi:ArsR/SmtB family transcription factor [Salsipaludibacter albus]|uniref:ArsR/SmtB family transcription factor n=1 Tax=Salsipaludibacter albus TaxID=2849650 RepID=UPI001EE4B0D2|nr:DUF5937 family protein [Salsipaludibacter albus]MBY5160904.1 metalloregulator ArsR/SmtB family transcription factor [Salsipaludibacter albus]